MPVRQNSPGIYLHIHMVVVIFSNNMDFEELQPKYPMPEHSKPKQNMNKKLLHVINTCKHMDSH